MSEEFLLRMVTGVPLCIAFYFLGPKMVEHSKTPIMDAIYLLAMFLTVLIGLNWLIEVLVSP